MSAEAVVGSYDQVAAEYYDAARHPTCANFRQASRLLLESLTPDAPPERSCEVGAGDSLLAELIHRRHRRLDGLLITDAAAAMLDYSRRWEEHGATLAVALASDLPLPDSSLLLLVASLADPYDDDRFWAEAGRVLSPGGRCVLTTPAAVWADRFRAETISREAAEFELRDGVTLYLPSHVRAPQQEREMIARHGLRVVEEAAAPLEALDAPISEKLGVLEASDPVVRGFVAQK